MPLSKRNLLLVFALLLSAGIMAAAAHYGAVFTSLGAAFGFAFAAIETALRANAGTLRNGGEDRPEGAACEPAHVASRRNAVIMAAVYGWGAAAFGAVYGLSGLWWFHAWQYGLAMALISAVLFGFAYLMDDEESAFRSPASLDISAGLAVLQAAGAAAALSFLVASGKLYSPKPDWAANHIFLGGGVALIGVSVIAALTHLRVRGRAAGA